MQTRFSSRISMVVLGVLGACSMGRGTDSASGGGPETAESAAGTGTPSVGGSAGEADGGAGAEVGGGTSGGRAELAGSGAEAGAPGRPDRGACLFSYYPYWRRSVDSVPYDRLTHLAYFWVFPQPDGSLDTSDVREEDLTRLVSRARVSGTKALILLGKGEALQPVASDPVKRRALVAATTSFVERYALDGVDVNWEPFDYVGFPNPADVAGWGELMAELCPELRSRGKLCTADLYSSGYSGRLIPTAVLEHTDFLNVMLYDYEGAWSSLANGHSAWARGRDGLAYWEGERGVPRSKLNIGVAAYGRAFGGATGPGQPFAGLGTKQDGYWAYAEIQAALADGTLEGVSGTEATGAYAFRKATASQAAEVVFYDSPYWSERKATYASQHGYHGVMVWEATMDASGADSLFATIDSALRR